jgi:hypothetical protein
MNHPLKTDSRFNIFLNSLSTEISRGLIRLAPALLVLYLATAFFDLSFIGRGKVHWSINIIFALVLVGWMIYKRIVIFSFLLVCFLVHAASFYPFLKFIGVNKNDPVPPFIGNALTLVISTFFIAGLLNWLKFSSIQSAEIKAKNAAIEAAKTPEQRRADAIAKKEADEAYASDKSEREEREWDEQCQRMHEAKSQEFFDDHHRH